MKREVSFGGVFAIAVLTVMMVAVFSGISFGKDADFTKLGNKVICPVSPKCPAFNITAGTPKAEYMGKTYFFHCAPCLTKFRNNPGKYVGMAPERHSGRMMAPEEHS